MASHEDPVDDQPQPPSRPAKTPPPPRKSIGTDPTMPIFLHRAPVPDPEPELEVEEAPATDDGGWTGAEQTLVGTPAPVSEASDRLPIVVMEDDSSGWLGAEKTALPASRPQEPEDESGWKGNDQTLVGAPAP